MVRGEVTMWYSHMTCCTELEVYVDITKRRWCNHVLLKCLIFALRHGGGESRTRSYIRPEHEEYIQLRFFTFDSYLASLNPDSFVSHTRTTPEEFERILSRLESRLSHAPTHRAVISPRHRLAICLHFLGHGMSFKCLAQYTKLGTTTVSSIVYECCTAIIQEFSAELLPVPTSETWSRAARRFKENLNYPRAVGAIDGKHFRCVCPRRSGSSYFNFKGFFSIVLLAVVDSDCRVMLMDCGGKGRMSDSGLFRSSPLKRFLERAAESFPPPEPLGRHGIVNYHILCDGGFAQTLHMQRPYTETEVGESNARLWFNRRFSSAQRVVESTFGIITSRFRVFHRSLHGLPRHCKLIITSAVILHNFMLRMNSLEDIVRRFPPLAESSAPVRSQSRQAFDEARRQRERIVNFFAEEDRI